MINNHFEIIVVGYNCKNWVLKCLQSVNNQIYRNFTCRIINDGSDDGTKEIIDNFILRNDNENQFSVIHNEVNNGNGFKNTLTLIDQIQDKDSTIITLDLDDFLSNNDVLSYLNNIYQDSNIWMTYGNAEAKDGSWKAIFNEVLDIYGYRNKKPFRWELSHLRSFKYKLFQKINRNDFKDITGEYYKYGWDCAFMLPCIEMSGPNHAKFIRDVLYNYNNTNSFSDWKQAPTLQIATAQEILAKPQYQPINSLD
jgi:glycosyltransferase involved in cell wall biosynthesis